MVKLFAIPNMRLYFLGNSLSQIGDFALWLAAGVWVKMLTGSTSQAGLCFACLAAGTLLSPLTGLLVDRVARRPLILVVNTLIGLLVLTLTRVHRADQVWYILVVMFLYGLGATTTNSAMAALLPKMVDKSQLGVANGLSQALGQLQRLITPALGLGLLVAEGAGSVAVLDAVSFGLSVLCWSFIKVEDEKPDPSGKSWRADTSAGFRFLFTTPVLRQLTLALTAAIFVLGFVETLAIAISTVGLHHAASWTGVIVTATAVSGVAGGVLAGPWVKSAGPGRLTTFGLALCCASAVVMAVPRDYVVIAGALLLGFGIPLIVVGSMTATQTHTPNELMGRVTSADTFLVTGGQALGIATGAWLVSRLPYRDLCFIVAVVLALSTAYLATRPQSRKVPEVRAPQLVATGAAEAEL